MERDGVKILSHTVIVKRRAPLEPSSPSAYHHGDLPNALRASAVEVILDKGLHGFSLREVARRAGVSHAAPGYHFGDVRGLLTAVAIEGFDTLHDELVRSGAGIDDPIERLKAIGRGYIRVAIEHPAHCEVMFRDDVVSADAPALAEAGLAAYGVLERAVTAIADRHDAELAVHDVARLCWSTMQGLIGLQAKFTALDVMLGRTPISLDEHVDRFIDLIISGLLNRRQKPKRPPDEPR